MLRLIIGTDWVAVRNHILASVSADVRAKKGNRILLVPELISHDMERRLCRAAGDTASRYAQVLSFTRLVRRVSDYVELAPKECLDGGGRVVAMASAAQQLHSRLKAYAALQTKPEFLTQLVDCVDELKRCCITSEDLASAAGQTEGTLAQKLEELSLLLAAYDSLCAHGKRDPRDQLTWLLEELEDSDFAQKHCVYIDGFPDFTRQNLAILQHFICNCETVTVGFNCDTPSSAQLAFEKAGDTAAQLIRFAEDAGIPVEIVKLEERDSDLGRACRALFQGNVPKNISNVHTFHAATAFEEVQIVARGVMDLVSGGARYRDISIVCSNLDGYVNYFNLLFHRCGIPLYLSGTESILDNPVLSTVLAALEAALGGFEQRDVFRYMRCALSGLSPDTCDALENYGILWGIRGNRWLEKWENHPDGLGECPTPASNARLDFLNDAKETSISPLLRLQNGFQKSTNLAQQVQALYAFLEDICYQERLAKLAQELEFQGDNRSAQICNQLWEILLGALEQMHSVLGNTHWDTENFTHLLKLLLSQYDVGTIPPVLDAVTVGSVSAMRCQQTKHLFVLGASEGNLPGYAGSEGLLSDQERSALRELGLPLTGGAMEGIQAEFAEIYGVFCGAEESITVSYCDAQPSYLFRRLAEMAGKEEVLKKEPGIAGFDGHDAAAYLVKLGAKRQAQNLGIASLYEDVRQKTEHSLGAVSNENIRSLYGDRLKLSASQIDCQAECRLSYFLKYGIKATQRKEATVDPAEFGTYIHAVLEQTARKIMSMGGFHAVSLEETLDIAMAFSDSYIHRRFRQMDSQRLQYLFRRNRRELEMVVTELWQELKCADFAPTAFELHFGQGGEMEPIAIQAKQMQAVLQGFVDRVDIYQENEKHYFRVVDYKTGRKDFDYCDIFNGIGLQMLLYLFALEQSGEGIVGSNPIGAGVQYFPARAPVVNADGRLTDELAAIARQKEWKRKGLLLQDESILCKMDGEDMPRLSCTRKKDGTIGGDVATMEQMKLLKSYVFSLLGSMVDDIASGNVTPNPYTRGVSHSACTYCPYGSICNKAFVEGRRNYKAMDAERFWTEVEKEVQGHG